MSKDSECENEQFNEMSHTISDCNSDREDYEVEDKNDDLKVRNKEQEKIKNRHSGTDSLKLCAQYNSSQMPSRASQHAPILLSNHSLSRAFLNSKSGESAAFAKNIRA
jgi:hypothetical protein